MKTQGRLQLIMKILLCRYELAESIIIKVPFSEQYRFSEHAYMDKGRCEVAARVHRRFGIRPQYINCLP